MSIGWTDPDSYKARLAEKKEYLESLFADFKPPTPVVFASQPQHFRMRAEFRIWHEDGDLHYVVFDPDTRARIKVTRFPTASERINALMMPLLEAVRGLAVLSHKLFQVEFLTSRSGQALVTLVYHKPLDNSWEEAAQRLAASLDVAVIGRSRRQKLMTGQDWITDSFTVGGRVLEYRQYENSFTQPNAGVNEQMLDWARRMTEGSQGDLLELYCGNGNFTCALADNFDRVLATEVSGVAVGAAQYNLERNGVTNTAVVRLSSDELAQALAGTRPFRRLAHLDLKSFRLDTVFVDPPRAGLDPATLALVQGFSRVLYMSCNPATLKENLAHLMPSHQLRALALFDQFPYTDHMETGVLLVRR